MKTHKSRINIPMCLACILFCLTLFSVYLMSGLYARYTATDSSSDSARVIKFGNISITETGDFINGNKLQFVPGVDITKSAVVNFTGSEAATYVFVEVVSDYWKQTDNYTFTDEGENFTWGVDSSWKYLKYDGNSFVYYIELAPNSTLPNDGFAAKIIKDDKIAVSAGITRFEITSMNNININLRASVVQAGGFDSVDAAWNAVSSKEG